MFNNVTIHGNQSGIVLGSDCHISSDQIRLIQKAQSKGEIRSIWGIIKDWFFGTNREEAKKALFDLCNGADSKVKLEAFSRLERLVAPGFKQYFYISMNSEPQPQLCIENILKVDLGCKDGPPDGEDLIVRIAELTEPTDLLSVKRQLDLIRKNIVCNTGVHYTFYCTPGIIKEYRSGDQIRSQSKREMINWIEIMSDYTPYQKKMLGFLMSPQLCKAMQTCRCNSGFRFLGPVSSYEQDYTMRVFNNGNIKVDVQYKGENPGVLFRRLPDGERVYRKISMDASFLIRRDEDKTELLLSGWEGTGLYRQISEQSCAGDYA